MSIDELAKYLLLGYTCENCIYNLRVELSDKSITSCFMKKCPNMNSKLCSEFILNRRDL